MVISILHLTGAGLRFAAQPCGLPTSLFRLTRLTYLQLGELHRQSLFKFGDLPAELFQSLRRLQHLHLHSCGVTSLPGAVGLLTNLLDLKVLSAVSRLRVPQLQLPAELSCCAALTRLELSAAVFPRCVLNMAAVRELVLDQCCPYAAEMKAFSRLTALQSLRLCNNAKGGERQLQTALAELRVPPSLRTLRLDRNSLEYRPLPSWLSQLPWLTQLQVLDLKANRWASAAACSLHALPLVAMHVAACLHASCSSPARRYTCWSAA